MVDIKDKEKFDKLQRLIVAIMFNHNISNGEKFSISGNADQELENHRYGIAHLSLPHRFGMYNRQTGTTTVSHDVKLSYGTENEEYVPPELSKSHKRRNIF